MSYAMIANERKPRRAQIFITHAWSENFKEFVESIESAVAPASGDLPGSNPTLWICAFALNQGGNIAAQLGADPRNAPFTRALACAESFLVVRNRAVNIYTRIWCCWELYCAYLLG